MPMMPGLLLRKRISSFLFVVCVFGGTYTPNGKKLPTPPRTMSTPVARLTMRLRWC